MVESLEWSAALKKHSSLDEESRLGLEEAGQRLMMAFVLFSSWLLAKIPSLAATFPSSQRQTG